MAIDIEDIQDKLVPISTAAGPTHVIATLPPSQDTTPDQIAFFHRPNALPYVRHSPLPAAAQAPVGATAAATAQTIVNKAIAASGATQAELDIPAIFTPVAQTVNLPGPLAFTLAPEPPGTVFQVPPTGSGSGRFDTSSGFSGSSSTPISGSVTPSLPNDFAVWFVATIVAGPINPNPGVGWTRVSTDPPLTGETTIYTQANISAPLSYSAAAPGSAYSGMVALFFTNGATPALVQPILANQAASPPALSVSLTNTAGSTNIVTVAFDNTTTNPSAFSLADTNLNTYATVGIASDGFVGGTRAIMYAATNVAAGPNTITFSQTGASAGIEISVTEWKNILQVTGIPSFEPLTANMIPPINLASNAVNGGVTGLLPHTSIAATAVTPGSYTNANITVQADGTLTAAANGSAGGTPGGSLGDIQIGDGTVFTNLAGRSGGGIFNASNTGNLTIEPIQNLQLDPGQLGFFGATPVAQETITGSRGGNAALASLLTKLATYGLIIDSSTP